MYALPYDQHSTMGVTIHLSACHCIQQATNGPTCLERNTPWITPTSAPRARATDNCERCLSLSHTNTTGRPAARWTGSWHASRPAARFFLFDRPRRATSVTGRFLSAAALAGTVVTCPDHRAGRQPMPADPPPPRPRRARPRRRDAAATRPDWWVCESLAPPYAPRAPEWVGPVWPLCTALPPTGTQPRQRS